MKIRILDKAEQDLINGYRFYEKQNEGLGNYFLSTLYSDIESLQLYAGIHSVHYGYYRLLSKRFPYAIYYKTESNIVDVWAILDCRQSPTKTVERLKSSPK
jgi:plasmid stabilization system protein ParE